jgi:Protein of unknown function (DUF3995)
MAVPHGRSISSVHVMRTLVAFALVAVLLALSLLHVYWGLGGRTAAAAAIPEVAGRPAFKPSRTGTLVVAMSLLAAAGLVATTGHLVPDLHVPRFARFLTFILGSVFVARSVGDFRLVGFFKRRSTSRFARLDSLVYAPLCLALGLSVLFVAYVDA